MLSIFVFDCLSFSVSLIKSSKSTGFSNSDSFFPLGIEVIEARALHISHSPELLLRECLLIFLISVLNFVFSSSNYSNYSLNLWISFPFSPSSTDFCFR